MEFEATLKNVGKLPSKVEPGFEPGTSNFTVYVTDPDGEVQVSFQVHMIPKVCFDLGFIVVLQGYI